MKLSRMAAVVVIAILSISHTGTPVAADVVASPTWAPAATAPIHPGVQTTTNSSQCTSNFVFYDATSVYIGQAAHCSATGLPNETNGCEAPMLPLGTPVQVQGATAPGTLVYNSWLAMQEANERSADACYGNDFALVRLSASDVSRVNPSVPFWGGPNSVDVAASGGESVYAYGNSYLRGGIRTLSRQFGFAVGESNGGWSFTVYMLTPGIPGDSGSAYLGSNGGALGVLALVSATLSNQVANLSKALQYMGTHSAFGGVQLADGTVPFNGGLIGQTSRDASTRVLKTALGR